MPERTQETRARITEIGRLMYERHLTDTAGGNISARVGDLICVTPRHSGSRFHWQLRPEQVIVMDLQGHKLEGEGEESREVKVHVRLYADFPDARAVVHAHAAHALVFCATGQPIPPVLECMLRVGEVPVVPFAPAHSQALLENIAATLRGQESRLKRQAAAALVPWHGLFVMAQDLDVAFDVAERIEGNARCILLGASLLRDRGWVQTQRSLLEQLTAPPPGPG